MPPCGPVGQPGGVAVLPVCSPLCGGADSIGVMLPGPRPRPSDSARFRAELLGVSCQDCAFPSFAKGLYSSGSRRRVCPSRAKARPAGVSGFAPRLTHCFLVGRFPFGAPSRDFSVFSNLYDVTIRTENLEFFRVLFNVSVESGRAGEGPTVHITSAVHVIELERPLIIEAAPALRTSQKDEQPVSPLTVVVSHSFPSEALSCT